MAERARLECRQPTVKGQCNLPVTELGEAGLIILNRHWSQKHINIVPYDWLVKELVKLPHIRQKLKIALDKSS